MTYRYCSNCNQWYSPNEYDVSESGEFLCRKGHGELHGSLEKRETVSQLRQRNVPTHSDFSREIEAALTQELVEADTDPYDLFN